MNARWVAASALAMLVVGMAAVRADKKADALLKKVEAATKAARTLTVDVTMTLAINTKFQKQKFTVTGTAKLKKPNLARIELGGLAVQKRDEMSGFPFYNDETIASDGKTVWRLVKAEKQYDKMPADPKGQNLVLAVMPDFPAALFFNSRFKSFGSLLRSKIKTRSLKTKTVEGKIYQVVEAVVRPDYPAGPGVTTIKLYIAPDRLVHRVAMITQWDANENKFEVALKNIQVNRPLANAGFAYEPPKDAKPVPVGPAR